jgi:hypothetical protein
VVSEQLDPRWDAPIFDVYGAADLDREGYPIPWSKPSRIRDVGGGHLVDDPEQEHWPPIKDLIRELTGHRCIRCLHPYVVGRSSVMADRPAPESYVESTLQLWEDVGAPDAEEVPKDRPILYSACDEQCTHDGPLRVRSVDPEEPWEPLDYDFNRYGRRGAGALVVPGVEVQAAYRILTVHHLNGDKTDCRWWNLCALCQRCHLSVQTRVEMDHPWPWEHSEWFRPYVAGYYAWKYEGRNITRAEALADMDRLLDLERGRYELRGERGTKGVRG